MPNTKKWRSTFQVLRHSVILDSPLLFLEEFFLFACINELLNKDVCSSLWRFVHTDALYNASCTSLSCEGCDCFLCHKPFSLLLNLTMKSHLVEVWVIFHTLKTLCCVLLVLGSNVPGNSRYTAFFLLGALQDDLHPVSFSFLCHNAMN